MLNKKGFTLMEVMTGMAIIAIVSGPFLQMFITSNRVSRRSYDTDKANTIAVAAIEEMKANPRSIPLDEEGKYSSIDYYDLNWNTAANSDYAFSVVTTVASTNSSGSIGLSYIPQLVNSSGASYVINIGYGQFPSGPYQLTVTSSDTDYTVACNSAILGLDGMGARMSVSFPKGDCRSNVLPIVVDDGQNTMLPVEFRVDNQTGLETALYVYGDYNPEDPTSHLVTGMPLSGNLSVNYMKVGNSALGFDELNVNVQVIRHSDNGVIVDYTTKVYSAS